MLVEIRTVCAAQAVTSHLLQALDVVCPSHINSLFLRSFWLFGASSQRLLLLFLAIVNLLR